MSPSTPRLDIGGTHLCVHDFVEWKLPLKLGKTPEFWLNAQRRNPIAFSKALRYSLRGARCTYDYQDKADVARRFGLAAHG